MNHDIKLFISSNIDIPDAVLSDIRKCAGCYDVKKDVVKTWVNRYDELTSDVFTEITFSVSDYTLYYDFYRIIHLRGIRGSTTTIIVVDNNTLIMEGDEIESNEMKKDEES